MSVFLIDADVLITADAQYYPFDRVPQFWDWLLGQAKDGVIKMPREIFEEVAQGRGDMPSWLRSREVSAAIVLSESVDSALLQYVLDTGYGLALTDVEVETCGRDPFLIAAALRASDRIVVTKEVSRPSAQRANRKVPDVCHSLGAQCIGDFKMLRLLGFSTR